ncbi:CDP-glucose 4,6-dehydratase [Butyrivibrio sp. ob235]|uniref:CDP-glucose 4,6-dehydratase n=1 Tax=Butyrivibrio sp. ob235 TaxID=1761780 RepID=UPI0008C2A128|nr:CDP-glucose 4,6-dehydratase [Butyrivibrio sp. ob235]SEM24931.1 CDP-glucose 4,6-dehydratase [Butyrivibrio sp. ob235]
MNAENLKAIKEFYSGKRVLVTGHTGFKGSWMCAVLCHLGADVYGYALEPSGDSKLYEILGTYQDVKSEIGDIRNLDKLKKYYESVTPEVVIHMAAQPIVRESYKDPVNTYSTNVMGTVNILECVRLFSEKVSFLNVTTDKVYENSERPDHAFCEDEKLDGYDPYSNSKSCSELVTHSYEKSFFKDNKNIQISTARAGNVIGGGDFAADRIIPDCVRATIKGESIAVRNPVSVRPYQHVLEPVFAYLLIAMRQTENHELSGSYNVGPDPESCVTTGELADRFVKCWGEGASWKDLSETDAPHEAGFLQLDSSKLKRTFDWKPKWHISEAIDRTVSWYKAWNSGEDMREFTDDQIREWMG